MKFNSKYYSYILTIQFSLLIADLFFNTFTNFLFRDQLDLIMLCFIAQDAFIIFEYALFTICVQSTCVAEVGASCIILRNCKLFLFTIFLYFVLSVSQHVWIVLNLLGMTNANWLNTLRALFFMQRITSIFYYYTYKRTALTLSNPLYYEQNIDWIVSQLNDK